MTVRVEFYGIVRRRVGVESVELEAETLGAVFTALSDACPGFAEHCLEGGKLRSGFLASINGTRFTTDATTRLGRDDSVLLLSADAGG